MQIQILRQQRLMGISLAAVALALLVSSLLSGLPALTSEVTREAVSAVPFLKPLPLAFVPNRGQAEDNVRYVARGQSTVAFTPQEVVLQVQGQALHLSFLDANPAPEIVAGTALPGVLNEIQGHDPAAWHTNLPTYAGLTYREIYPGVNLRYNGLDGQLKSTFTLAPGAAPALIRWQYGGAQAVAVDRATGDLRVTLSDETLVVEKAPIAWQEVGGQRVPVAAAFALAADNSVSFALGSYDASAPLIIDPTIVYETTLNLGDFGRGADVAIDADGNAYVLGQVIYGANDVVIVKLSSDGSLLYTTYLRGSKGDFGGGIALDSSGDVYVAGYTDSYDFPILNAIKPVKDGVTREAFIAKLAAADGALLFSTYFGGSRSDEIHDITLNSAGEIYVVGYTESTDFPTVNPIQDGLNLNQCFCEDTFVTKLSPDAQTVLYSTYLGGSFEDYGQSIALDANDNIYITGSTQSDDFPTQAAIQPNRAGEFQDTDLFVSKISADGSSLVYSTYLGGTRNEAARRMAVDSAGNAFVAGTTLSADFPTTAGAYRDQYIGEARACLSGLSTPVDCNDMFVTKFVPDGSSLAYSTYLGGGLHDYANGIAIDEAGEAYVVGYTNSADIPGVDQNDIVVAKLNASGSDLLYAVGINSPVYNAGHGIALDNAGDIYITGAQNVPSELYVVKISDSGAPPPPTATPTPVPPTPTPTPTPAPGGTLHVGDLDGARAWVYRKWFWGARVTIAVHDVDHNPVSGASVSGSWSGGYSGSAQCTTGADGTCSVDTGNIWRRQSNVTLALTDANAAGYTYTPTGNHDPDGDSNGTQITVSKP